MQFIYNNNVSAVVIVYNHIICLYPKRYSKLQSLIMYCLYNMYTKLQNV